MNAAQFWKPVLLISALVIVACAPGRSNDIETGDNSGNNNPGGNTDGGTHDAGGMSMTGTSSVSGTIVTQNFHAVAATTLAPLDGGIQAPVVYISDFENTCGTLATLKVPDGGSLLSLILIGEGGALTTGTYTVNSSSGNSTFATFMSTAMHCTAEAISGTVNVMSIPEDGGAGTISGSVALEFGSGENFSGNFAAPTCDAMPNFSGSPDGGTSATCGG